MRQAAFHGNRMKNSELKLNVFSLKYITSEGGGWMGIAGGANCTTAEKCRLAMDYTGSRALTELPARVKR
jgi:hypothetical protein